MTGRGHFDPFPQPKLNGRCPFRRYVRGAVGRRPALDAQ
jgi:hypothetical protein